MMGNDYKRPDPDVLLAQIKAQEEPTRGRLRIWLGVAPGAGTTYAMLQEGRRRKSRGTDVVIGFVETHGRPRTAEQIGDLEIIPPREVVYKGVTLREMDTEAVIARRPQVVLVDELAHTNAPGSKHEKRYQDVFELLEAGITVISTLNVSQIESLSEQAARITGLDVGETIPDWVLDQAEQIELVDLPPEVLIQRMQESSDLSTDAQRTLANVFNIDKLMMLRELALRATAREVEERLDVQLREQKVEGLAVGERIMAAVDHHPVGEALIRRSWHLVNALKGEFIVVHVDPIESWRKPWSAKDESQLRANLQLAADLGAKVIHLQGRVAEELTAYARANHVSHIFIGHPTHSRWWELLRGSVTRYLLHRVPGARIHVIADPNRRRSRKMGVERPSTAQQPEQESQPMSTGAQEVRRRARLLLYLGAAPGVGKTYAMLQEGRRRKSRGTDVVIGFVETHGRPRTAEQIGDLEIIPPREVVYKGVTLREMDTEAVIARRPQVVLVDELAHTNAPGSKHEKRYQDVFELLEAGIEVHSTMNIQHLESLHDSVEQITGVCVRETVPDWILDEADQIELVDMAPEALIRRMIHGNIYPPEQAKRALENFFTLRNLAALRDLSLRITAREIENKLSTSERNGGTERLSTREKVMVAVDHRPSAKNLIREGCRMAAALKGELIVVHVEPAHSHQRLQSVEEDRQLRSNLQLASELRAKMVHLRGKVSEELINYARANHVSQLIIGHSTGSRWGEILHGSITDDILRELPGIDIHVIPTREAARGNILPR